MARSTKRTCQGCDYWDLDEPTHEVGECRRYAPRPDIDDGSVGLIFPNYPCTGPDHWCGEWSSKEID